MRQVQVVWLAVALMLAAAHTGLAQSDPMATETVTDAADRTALSITIYNQDLALVRDSRRVSLPAGRTRLAFEGVSAKIKAPTALLNAAGLSLIEQNFDYDLLTPQKLLDKAVGSTVRLYRTNPATGEETVETAQVLAANDGAVLQIGDRIETLAGDRLPGRIVFDSIPANLRPAPTLSMTVAADSAGERTLELTYLTAGLSWSADYVGVLSDDETRLSLQGLVTLVNQSGIRYREALTQLVAGDVNQVPDSAPAKRRDEVVVRSFAAGPVQEEALLDFHLYTLPEPTSIAQKQTKQVGFLSAPGVDVEKQYQAVFSTFSTVDEPRGVPVRLAFTNTADAGLGKPLPAGIVRIYTDDSAGRAQFVGEDRIDHTPDGSPVNLALGRAFDVQIQPRTLRRETLARSQSRRVFEVEQRYRVTNARTSAVTVDIEQRLPGDWEILDESDDHKKLDAHRAGWSVDVPAEGSKTLSFTVRVEQ